MNIEDLIQTILKLPKKQQPNYIGLIKMLQDRQAATRDSSGNITNNPNNSNPYAWENGYTGQQVGRYAGNQIPGFMPLQPGPKMFSDAWLKDTNLHGFTFNPVIPQKPMGNSIINTSKAI